MKNLISLLALCAILAGCELHPASSVVIVEEPLCEPEYELMYGAAYCDQGCCYYKDYNAGWICEEAWCFGSYSCQWEYATTFCY